MKTKFKDIELFVDYDIKRLEAYSNINKGIEIKEDNDGIYLFFNDVNYFNYSILKSKNINSFIEKSISYYKSKNISQYKLLIRNSENNLIDKALLYSNNLKSENRLLIYEDKNFTRRDLDNNLTMLLVNKENIETFSYIYLTAFGSNEKDIKKVSANFSYLLNNPYIELFLIIDKQENNVGIASTYIKDNIYFLSSGAILPQYRNKNYHKNILIQRMNKAADKNIFNIYSWAYENSISANNMKNIGMKNTYGYHIYEF